MQKPYALLEVKDLKSGLWVWVTKTPRGLRGTTARRIVFLREPTKLERACVEPCLAHSEGFGVYHLKDLLGASSSLAP